MMVRGGFGIFAVLFILTACASHPTIEPYAAPRYEMPPPQIGDANNNVIIVRHAYAECGDVQCDLTDDGYGQAARLKNIIMDLVDENFHIVDILASNACRTVLTLSSIADEKHIAMNLYPAGEGSADCAYLGDKDEMQRPDETRKSSWGFVDPERRYENRQAAQASVKNFQSLNLAGNSRHLFLIADHSNRVCGWLEALGVPTEEYQSEGNCVDGNLAHTDFADIFWAYDADNSDAQDWHVIILENGFDIDKLNTFEH